MLQEDGSPEPVQVDLDDPADAGKFVPGARLRVSGTRNVPPGQQKEQMKRIKAINVQVLSGRGRWSETVDGGEVTPQGNPNKPQPDGTPVGTVQQLAVKLAVMKLLVVPSEP